MIQISNIKLLAICAALTLSCAALRAEDAPGDKPKTPDQPKAPDQPKPGDRAPGGANTRGGGRGNWQGGPGGMGGMLGNVLGGAGGANGVLGMVSRMLGVDIEDPKAAPKLDQLPLSTSKRMVTEIPVGGVDNFNATGSGWKMETVFKMTPEQTKATDALRDEYQAEQKKLNQEILDAEKALAAKVVDLRQKYEKKANDLLTGTDKENKEKMDALAVEVYSKNSATVTETLPLYDTKDWQQGLAMVRALREKTGKVTQDAEDKLLTLIPEDNRPKFQEILKAQSEQRNRMNQGMQNFGGMRNRAQGDGGTVKPPKAPEGDKF